MATVASSLSGLRPCAAFIQFTCFDPASQQTIVLGGLGHLTVGENDEAWSALPPFDGQSAFQASKLDADRHCIEQRQLSAQACEEMLRRPIGALLAAGRARLSASAEKRLAS